MEYLLIFLKNKISLYGSRAYIASVLSLVGSRLNIIIPPRYTQVTPQVKREKIILGVLFKTSFGTGLD